MDLKKPDRPSTASPLGKPNLVLSNVSAATKIRHRNTINSTITTMPLAAKRVLYLMLAQFDPKRPLAAAVRRRNLGR